MNVPRPSQTTKRSLRWESQRRFFPLVNVAMGPDVSSGEARGRARGIIAVGDIASGVIAVGGFAQGVLAFGGFATRGVAVGGIAIGIVSFGGLAVAVLFALGGLPIAGARIGIWPLAIIAIVSLIGSYITRVSR